MGFSGSSDGKESACNMGDLEDPLEKGTPLQYSCPEKPMDRGVWQATVHGVAKSQELHAVGEKTLTLSLYNLDFISDFLQFVVVWL